MNDPKQPTYSPAPADEPENLKGHGQPANCYPSNSRSARNILHMMIRDSQMNAARLQRLSDCLPVVLDVEADEALSRLLLLAHRNQG
jgi:hypothetical protein